MLVLTRLLSPADFGVVGMTTLFVGLLGILAESGLSTTIVTSSRHDRQFLSRMNTLALLFGCACAASCIAGAPLLAAFFRTPALTSVVTAMSANFVLTGLATVSRAMRMKELRFRLNACIDAGQCLIQASVALALAWLGLGYWSLVWALVAGTAFATAATLVSGRYGFGNPFRRELRSELAFSWRLLVSRLAWYGYSNSDFAIAGRFLGGAALGVYSLAWNIASVPVDKISAVVLQVVSSVLSRVRADSVEHKRYCRLLIEGISLLTFPVAIGAALVAGPFAVAVLDPRWAGVVNPLRLLAIASAVRCVSVLIPPVLASIRDGKFIMWQSILGLAIVPAVLIYTSRWGPTGLGIGWLVAQPILAAPLFWRLSRKVGMPPRDIFGALRTALVCCGCMTTGVLAIKLALPSTTPPLQAVLIQGVAGAALYGTAVFVHFRARVKTLRGLLRPSAEAVAA